LAQQGITVDGRTYESPEAMPPEVRRIYDRLMGQVGPAMKDRDRSGIPDIAEGGSGPRLPEGVVIEKHMVVNGQTFRSVEEMPPDVRAAYEDAMGRLRGGAGVKVTFKAPTFDFRVSRSTGADSPRAFGAPRPIEPSMESHLRSLVVSVILFLAGLAVWVWWGR
jgi:hypothetical protein